ncbi:MAG TPA: efflux RND transporter periplasmic adaptor subunit [Usitatibacter sp.]|jgi:HlyD family secretion protein|nr:efflux RND transporter periplasmic adaptor subunit [Usitatibacter sp.]
MIRDTSAQDTALAPATGRTTKRMALGVVAALALVALSTWLFAGWRSSTHVANAERLRIVPATQGTLVRDASVNGRVVAAVSPTLFTPAPGTVALQVHAGDAIRKGQVLAVIASPDLDGALKREQSTYEELQAEIARQEILAQKQKLIAVRDADQAEIDRAAARRAFERIEKVGGLGIVAKNDFEKAQDALRSAEIRGRHAAEAARLEGSDVELQLRTRRAQLQRQRLSVEEARRRVEELTLRAPMDGLVGSVAIADRTALPANAPVMTLVDLSRLEVEVEIPETYVADLGLGMKAEIVAGEMKATGHISAISPEVVRNQVLARVRFDGAQPQGLRQSQRVSARLLIDEKPHAIMLPRGPFVEAHGGKFAYVVEDGFAVRRPIRLGGTSLAAVEIASGIKPGERVVVAGSEDFDNADRVRINE